MHETVPPVVRRAVESQHRIGVVECLRTNVCGVFLEAIPTVTERIRTVPVSNVYNN